MGDPFMAELRLMGGYRVPKGWAACNGQILPINQNQGLYSLLGTTYGGNGMTTFALPDLKGKVPMHLGNGHIMGERAGQDSVTVTLSQLPQHTHVLRVSPTDGDTPSPNNGVFARTVNNIYVDPAALTNVFSQTVSSVGGSQPHPNEQPYLTLNWCIALLGIFPTPN